MKYKGIWFLSVLALRVIFGQKSVLMTLSQPLALSNLSTWDSYSFSKFPDFAFWIFEHCFRICQTSPIGEI